MMPEHRYELIIYWSNDDQAFIAEVPELPGCAADGASYGEAVSNVEVVIAEWIETAQEMGRPIPEPRGRSPFAQVASRCCQRGPLRCVPAFSGHGSAALAHGRRRSDLAEIAGCASGSTGLIAPPAPPLRGSRSTRPSSRRRWAAWAVVW